MRPAHPSVTKSPRSTATVACRGQPPQAGIVQALDPAAAQPDQPLPLQLLELAAHRDEYPPGPGHGELTVRLCNCSPTMP